MPASAWAGDACSMRPAPQVPPAAHFGPAVHLGSAQRRRPRQASAVPPQRPTSLSRSKWARAAAPAPALKFLPTLAQESLRKLAFRTLARASLPILARGSLPRRSSATPPGLAPEAPPRQPSRLPLSSMSLLFRISLLRSHRGSAAPPPWTPARELALAP